MLARSIPAQKAARVRLVTGPPTLTARLTWLVAVWEDRTNEPGRGEEASAWNEAAAELWAELER